MISAQRREVFGIAGLAAMAAPAKASARIAPSGLAVEIADWLAMPRTRSSKPYTGLQQLKQWGAHLYVCDTRGKLWRVDPTTKAITLYLDMALWRLGALVTLNSTAEGGGDARWGGFRDFAFDPTGQFLYTSTVETIASRPADTPVYGGDFAPVHHCVLAEWRLVGGLPVQTSRRELFRVAVWRKHHNLEPLLFGPGGKLFVGMGDGGNNDVRPDPYDVAQDLGCMLGKWLRIIPYRTATRRYTIPTDAPFLSVEGALPEIHARGVRHPMTAGFRDVTTGPLIFCDIGQARIEEVNILVKGGNYGWPLREGPYKTTRSGTNGWPLIASPPGSMIDPIAFYDQAEEGATTSPQAICGGGVSKRRAANGQYLCGDIPSGRIFHTPGTTLAAGVTAQLHELTLVRGGVEVTLAQLVQGNSGRVDLRLGQDAAGEVYVLSKQDGMIRKIHPAD